jgi:hypothetical protein
MTLDRIKTSTGRKLRNEALQETALPIPYDAAAMPGATVLGTDGQVYMSTKIDGVYSWSRILNAERLVIGGDRDNFTIDLASGGFNYKPAIAVEGLDNETSTISLTRIAPSAAGTPRLIMAKSRGTTLGSDVVLQDGDSVAIMLFSASDGTSLIGGAGITARVDGTPQPGSLLIDGTPVPGNVPMHLLARTRALGDAGLFERLRITPNGNVLIGNTTGTERLSVTGNIQLTNTADSFKVGTNNVVGSRKTGWDAPTGTATRTTFATSTVTTAQLAERLKALIDDLTSHGLIGPTPA